MTDLLISYLYSIRKSLRESVSIVMGDFGTSYLQFQFIAFEYISPYRS